jgi:hypothetical protein
MMRLVDSSLFKLAPSFIPFSTAALAQRVDRAVLRTFNHYLPVTFDRSYDKTPDFESVLAQTQVNLPLVPEMGFLNGEYRFRLRTVFGRIPVRLRVLPARHPEAPLVLYQHGFNIIPYDSRGRVIFSAHDSFDAHVALLQFPFHTWPHEPIRKAFASIHHLYEMLSGSLRLMEMVQTHYEQLGVTRTIVAGTSLGGVSALLYEALFQRTQAVIPLYSSPNMAQLLWDAGQMLHRPAAVPRNVLCERLDFTPLVEQADHSKIYPLLGEQDLFFRYDHHADFYHDCPMSRAGNSHMTAMVNLTASREHVLSILARLAPDY